MLVIPPNSLGKWQEHASFISKHPDASISAIRTLVTFDEKVQGTLNFQALGWITAETMEEVEKVSEQTIVAMVGADDKPSVRALPGNATTAGPQQTQIAQDRSNSFKEPEQQMPAQKRESNPPDRAPTSDGFFGEKEAPKAEAKPKGRPKANGGAAFGMQEANTVSDPVLEKSLAEALGWQPE